jgi:hypothetical protein
MAENKNEPLYKPGDPDALPVNAEASAKEKIIRVALAGIYALTGVGGFDDFGDSDKNLLDVADDGTDTQSDNTYRERKMVRSRYMARAARIRRMYDEYDDIEKDLVGENGVKHEIIISSDYPHDENGKMLPKTEFTKPVYKVRMADFQNLTHTGKRGSREAIDIEKWATNPLLGFLKLQAGVANTRGREKFGKAIDELFEGMAKLAKLPEKMRTDTALQTLSRLMEKHGMSKEQCEAAGETKGVVELLQSAMKDEKPEMFKQTIKEKVVNFCSSEVNTVLERGFAFDVPHYFKKKILEDGCQLRINDKEATLYSKSGEKILSVPHYSNKFGNIFDDVANAAFVKTIKDREAPVNRMLEERMSHRYQGKVLRSGYETDEQHAEKEKKIIAGAIKNKKNFNDIARRLGEEEDSLVFGLFSGKVFCEFKDKFGKRLSYERPIQTFKTSFAELAHKLACDEDFEIYRDMWSLYKADHQSKGCKLSADLERFRDARIKVTYGGLADDKLTCLVNAVFNTPDGEFSVNNQLLGVVIDMLEAKSIEIAAKKAEQKKDISAYAFAEMITVQEIEAENIKKGKPKSGSGGKKSTPVISNVTANDQLRKVNHKGMW